MSGRVEVTPSESKARIPCRIHHIAADVEGNATEHMIASVPVGPEPTWCPIGYVKVRQDADDFDPDAVCAYAADLFVQETYRHLGIGRALMEGAVDFARAACTADPVVWVLADDARLRAWYESMGWVLTHERLDFDDHGKYVWYVRPR